MTANAGWQDVCADHAGLMTARGKLLAGAQDAVRQLNHLLPAPSVQVNAALVEILQQMKIQ